MGSGISRGFRGSIFHLASTRDSLADSLGLGMEVSENVEPAEVPSRAYNLGSFSVGSCAFFFNVTSHLAATLQVLQAAPAAELSAKSAEVGPDTNEGGSGPAEEVPGDLASVDLVVPVADGDTLDAAESSEAEPQMILKDRVPDNTPEKIAGGADGLKPAMHQDLVAPAPKGDDLGVGGDDDDDDGMDPGHRYVRDSVTHEMVELGDVMPIAGLEISNISPPSPPLEVRDIGPLTNEEPQPEQELTPRRRAQSVSLSKLRDILAADGKAPDDDLLNCILRSCDDDAATAIVMLTALESGRSHLGAVALPPPPPQAGIKGAAESRDKIDEWLDLTSATARDIDKLVSHPDACCVTSCKYPLKNHLHNCLNQLPDA